MAHEVEGGVIENGVVEQQHRHHALAGRVVGEHQTQQRRLAQVHAIAARVVTRDELREDIAAGETGLFADQGCLAPHHLQRLVQALPHQRGAQDVVAVDHPLQRLGESVQAGAAVEYELRVQHVGVALLRREVVVEHALLQRRQRVDVLHVRRATGDGRNNAVNGVLAEADQRQHLRRDAIGRAEPVAAMLGHQFEEPRFVGDQLIP
ncbi:hypothetical protein [Pseudomonas sp. 25 E 4]|nr:hypothetical protein [Pseudomonas sp. 25 E 4]